MSLTTQQTESIVELYKVNKNLSEISKILNISVYMIKKTLMLGGIKFQKFISKNSKYKLNESVFREINSPEKAYWIGYLAADGYIFSNGKGHSSRNGVTLLASIKDIDLIKSFLGFIECERPIRRVFKKALTTEEVHEYASVSIANVVMAKDLISHGLIQNKSLTLKPPHIPKDLVKYYILGYFDGDGCISVYKGKSGALTSNVSFTGTFEVCSWIQKFFLEKDINFSLYQRTPNKNTWGLMSTGNCKTVMALNELYSDAENLPFLKRKYELYIDVKKRSRKLKAFYIRQIKSGSWFFDFQYCDKRHIKYSFETQEDATTACEKAMIEVGHKLGLKKLLGQFSGY